MNNLIEGNKKAVEFHNGYSSYIKELCAPLEKYLGIKHFHYAKLCLKTNHYIVECSDHSHVKKYMQSIFDSYYLKTNFVYQTDKYYIALVATSLDKKDHILQLFFDCDLCNGLGFYKMHKDYNEAWAFFGGANNENTLSSCIKNISILEKFISHYERKISQFRNQNTPLYAKFLSFDSLLHGLNDFISESEAVNEFLSCIHADGYEVVSNKGFIRLTKREYQCLSYLGLGATIKSIAKKLQLSPKTVEAHVGNVKLKTGINYKADLVDWFHEVKEI